MFAAFPYWYATLFSGFYLPLLLILAALIVRGVAFEYRGKVDDARWRRRWDACIVVGSFVPALLWGVAFANIVRGVPIDADGNFTGTLFTLLNPFGLLGGLATVALFCTYGAIFVALKTVGRSGQEAAPRGPDRHDRGAGSARSSWCGPAGARRRGLAGAWRAHRGRRWSRAWWPTPREREGWAFGLVGAGVVGLVGHPVRGAVPGRHAVEHGPGVQPHRSRTPARRRPPWPSCPGWRCAPCRSCSPTRRGPTGCSASASAAPASRPSRSTAPTAQLGR